MEQLIDYSEQINKIINNGTSEEFINFAKSYNIFQVSRSKRYTEICNQIKQRLDKEGLDHEVVRPD